MVLFGLHFAVVSVVLHCLVDCKDGGHNVSGLIESFVASISWRSAVPGTRYI